ncbi:MAG: hypothetical protein GX334_04990 [Firmicutes bacterium]|nr:hypothetical protein [Bacillota bacterium]
MRTLLDYVVSLTNLYGLVHKEKVLEIYNLQNEEQIDINIIEIVRHNFSEDLLQDFVRIYGDYFVHETIMEFDEFDSQLRQRAGKPFYIPAQAELLKYRDDCFFEKNKEYRALLEHITKNLLDGDEKQGALITDDLQGYCQQGFSPAMMFDLFNDYGFSFKDEKQVNETVQLVMNLANNTRIWENNGFTPHEIFEKYERPHLQPLPEEPFDFGRAGVTRFESNPGGKKKVGRNDPCPCGSGKKYKKCCLGKN